MSESTREPHASAASTEPATTTERVLIAVDLGAASEEVVFAGLRLADALHAEPVLLYAYSFPLPLHDAFLADTGRALHDQALRDLQQLARRCDPKLTDAQLVVRSGATVDTIVTTARALDARLVVMGRCAPAQTGRRLMGSTAESVCRRAPCAVLVVPRRTAAPHAAP